MNLLLAQLVDWLNWLVILLGWVGVVGLMFPGLGNRRSTNKNGPPLFCIKYARLYAVTLRGYVKCWDIHDYNTKNS